MSETIPNTAPERRKPDTVVTSENLSEYINQKLDIADAKTPAPEPVKNETTEASPKQEALPLETEEKDSAVDDVHEDTTDDENKKTIKKANSKIEKRFSELTAQRNEAKARAEAAERKAAELEAKLKPAEPAKIEDKAKPNPSEYTDAYKYAEDLAEWSAKKVLKERDESDRKSRIENERQRVLDSWTERLEATKKEIPEFEEKMANSTVLISDDMRDAILDSDVGPKILLHLAENPDIAANLSKMTVGKALTMLGRIEAKLIGSVKENTVTESEPKAVAREAEVSKAPAPISPLKGASASADLPINSRGEWTGSHEQYKEARRAGKIK